jgi:hypothetical protein
MWCLAVVPLPGLADQWEFPRGYALSVALSLLAMLMILLYTLVCIIHCSFVSLQAAAPASLSTSPDAFPPEQPLVICHTPGATRPDMPAPIAPGTLRALSELSPVLRTEPAVFADSVMARLLYPFALPLKPLVYHAPETPPPRLLPV